MHRDFQSRNLMVHQGRLWLIDFQGMRFGPPAYDLAALLIDPYVTLPESLQQGLIELYWSAAGSFLGGDCQGFRQHLQAVRLCRNLQVLGAYGFSARSRRKRVSFGISLEPGDSCVRCSAVPAAGGIRVWRDWSPG